MKRYISYVLLAMLLVLQPLATLNAEGATRVFNTGRSPFRLLAKQFVSSANVFTIVDPTPAGTPLALTNATGISGMDGSVTIHFMAGFTAPITVTAFVWQADNVTPTNSAWVRLGNISTAYSASVDSNYTTISFTIPENMPFLVMTSAAVTGLVYIDAKAHPSNANSAAGF